ncbi:MAG TPA: YraN family protein [Sphingomonadales bacterium]|nr:YraN family protein [Sphingomonadales bacterium]
MTTAKTQKQLDYEKGHKGEGLAVWLLRLKGYQILKRRYKMKVGEADIVARKGGTVVFAEVKARPTVAEGLEAITASQRKRILNAARYFMVRNRAVAGLDYRFDVIVVTPGLRIHHLEDAWRA